MPFLNCIVPLSGLNSTSSRHHRTQPQAFYDTFSLFGNILSCKVATDENGKSKGYGYVHYETGVSANMAIAKVDGMLIAGKQVQSRSRSLRRKLTQASMKRLRNIYVFGKIIIIIINKFGGT